MPLLQIKLVPKPIDDATRQHFIDALRIASKALPTVYQQDKQQWGKLLEELQTRSNNKTPSYLAGNGRQVVFEDDGSGVLTIDIPAIILATVAAASEEAAGAQMAALQLLYGTIDLAEGWWPIYSFSIFMEENDRLVSPKVRPPIDDQADVDDDLTTLSSILLPGSAETAALHMSKSSKADPALGTPQPSQELRHQPSQSPEC